MTPEKIGQYFACTRLTKTQKITQWNEIFRIIRNGNRSTEVSIGLYNKYIPFMTQRVM